MGIPDRFVDGMPKRARPVRAMNKAERLLLAVVYGLLLLTLFTACNAEGADPSTSTPAPLAATSTSTPTATLTVPGVGAILFTTPPPVRTEEPLTGANRNIPSVFAGIDTYTPVQATLRQTDLPLPPATSLAEAALAVVQIRRCDSFGCNTPGGSGVIIHPSGLILTAYHVLQTDPDDPTSGRYQDFVIAVTVNTRDAPQPRYRARLVAEKADQDLALLMIDRDQAGTALASGQIELPALPLADITKLFDAALPILGYPVNGGEAISRVPANFISFDDSARLIVVDRALNSGNSGGPALVEQAGRFAIAGIVIRRRSTQGQLSQEGLLRAIDQLDTLTWTPKMVRAWGEAVQANAQVSREGDLLRLTLTLTTLDLRTRPLRLLFYATDAATGQPWRPANASAPLVVWADVMPQQVIDHQALTLTVPVASLGTTPDRLRFHALLWDTAQGNPLWSDASGVQAALGVIALAFTATPAVVSVPTLTTTPNPTVIPQPTETPTTPPTATQAPTATATAVPTATPAPTATSTSPPTATPTLAPTPTSDAVLAYNITNLVKLAPNEIMRLGRGLILQVAYAPDGKRLAVATGLGIWLYNVDSPNAGRLLPYTTWVSSVSWSPDGAKLLFGAWESDTTIHIWDATSGQQLITITDSQAPYRVSWSPDGSKLASAGYTSIRIWDATNGQLLNTLTGHSDPVDSVSWSPDSRKLASGSDDHTVRIWDVASGQTLITLTGHSNSVDSVSWSPDGTKLASGSNDNTVRIWDVANGQTLTTLIGHTSPVRSVSWSPDGTKLASGSNDNTIRIWDMANGQLLTTLTGHTSQVVSVSWSPDSTQLTSGSNDNTIRIWDTASGQPLTTLTGHMGLVTGVSWSLDGTKLASGSSDGTVRIWDAASGQPLTILQGYAISWVNSGSWSPDGSKLASGSNDNTIRIWDTASGQPLTTLIGQMGWVSSVSWSPDGSKLASGSGDNTIRIWDVANSQSLATLTGHTSSVRSVSWSPDGTKLASGSDDHTARIWDATSGKLLITLTGHTDTVNSVSWSPDGTKLASGSYDSTVRIWDAMSGELLITLTGHTAWVTNVSWSPDGGKLVAGSGDQTVHIWDMASGQTLTILQGHSGPVNSVSWSPDGSKLLSGSEDGTVRIWRAP